MAHATGNRVLLSLGAKTRRAVMEGCERAEFAAGTVLEKTGDATAAVYFPGFAVISTLAAYSDGSTIEMANIGREACTGINLALGQPRMLNTNEVQIAGAVHYLPADRFQSLKSEFPGFERALFATIQAVFYQVMVSGACNGAHSAQQRLARWLLTMHDRADGEEMRLTHEFLGHMLGVRRATVSTAAAALQDEGLISYSHGRMAVTDHPGLRAASCECYELVRRAYDHLLPEKSGAA